MQRFMGFGIVVVIVVVGDVCIKEECGLWKLEFTPEPVGTIHLSLFVVVKHSLVPLKLPALEHIVRI